MIRQCILVLLGCCLILTSCLEAEVEFDLKKNGAGEMRMKVLPLDKSLNLIMNDLEADLMKNQNYKESDIKKGIESDGRRSLFVRKKFIRVEEADQNCKFVSQKDHDEFIMNIPSDFLGIVKKVKVNMPGQIFESNVKNFQSKSLVWDRSSSSLNKLIIKSKKSEPIGEVVTLILILCMGVIVAILIFKKVRKLNTGFHKKSFCPECGAKADPGDSFCQNCGQGLQ